MRVNFRKKFFFSLIMIIFIVGFIFINQARCQEEIDKSEILAQKTSDWTRVIISTSGAAKFTSFWLDGPPRLVIEFQSRNILSRIGKEVIVDQDVIKKITSSYVGRGQNRSLKSLTFELSAKVPYRIWQEENTIILEIQRPLEVSGFSVGSEGIFIEGESKDVIIKRLEAMDAALLEVADKPEIEEEILEGIEDVKEEVVSPVDEVLPIVVPEVVTIPEDVSSIERKTKWWSVIFWIIGLASVSGLTYLTWAWYRHRLNKDERLKRLELELKERDKRLKQEETLRQAIEKAAIEKEKEYKELRRELQEKGKEYKSLESVLQKQNKRSKEVEALRAAAEKKVLEKEQEYTKLKDSYDTLEDTMIKKTAVEKMLTPEGKERLWIHRKSEERRASPRFSLSKDFNKTIVLRIGTSPQTYIRSFVNNVSSGGLCFETEKEFEITKPINLRLFFYGDKVPMLKAQSRFIWKRRIGEIIYYGVCFELMDEKNKQELDCYIESNISEEAMVEV